MPATSTSPAAPGTSGQRPLSVGTRVADYSVIALAAISGGGSIALFAWAGRPMFVPMGLSPAAALWWDALLSVVFFLQHSVMVRRPVRGALSRLIPDRYDRAFYAFTSGVALTLVLVLWQPTGIRLFTLEGVPRIVLTAAGLLALVGFVWGVYALRTFDPFGLRPIREHLAGASPAAPVSSCVGSLVVRGPYRWVRHPLYSCVIVLLWADPEMSAERLMMAASWSAWIYVGALLEERDLIADFGDEYRRYRRLVPILVPWRGRFKVEARKPQPPQNLAPSP